MALRPWSRNGAEATECSGWTANSSPVRKLIERRAEVFKLLPKSKATVLAEVAQGSKVKLAAVNPCRSRFVKWYLRARNAGVKIKSRQSQNDMQ